MSRVTSNSRASDTDGAVRIETAGGALSLERDRDTHRALLDGPVTFARHSTAGQHGSWAQADTGRIRHGPHKQNKEITALEKHHPLLARKRLSGVDLSHDLRRTVRRLRAALHRTHRSRLALSGYTRLAASRRGTARRYRRGFV